MSPPLRRAFSLWRGKNRYTQSLVLLGEQSGEPGEGASFGGTSVTIQWVPLLVRDPQGGRSRTKRDKEEFE